MAAAWEAVAFWEMAVLFRDTEDFWPVMAIWELETALRWPIMLWRLLEPVADMDAIWGAVGFSERVEPPKETWEFAPTLDVVLLTDASFAVAEAVCRRLELWVFAMVVTE